MHGNVYVRMCTNTCVYVREIGIVIGIVISLSFFFYAFFSFLTLGTVFGGLKIKIRIGIFLLCCEWNSYRNHLFWMPERNRLLCDRKEFTSQCRVSKGVGGIQHDSTEFPRENS